jgi:Ca-activated chloride channel family protein
VRWIVIGALALATALAATAARGKGATAGGGDGGAMRFAASPSRPVSFRGTLDKTAVLVGGTSTVRMELAIGGEANDGAKQARSSTDLVVVLDRSGSMSGEKIESARQAIRELIGRLGPEDRFALVTYSNDATLAIAPAAADDQARGAWLEAIAAIRPDGGTNMSSGIDLAMDTLERGRATGRVPRAILISDGLANQGDATPEGLRARASRAARGEFMLTTVGVGADFNEFIMRALADAGTGNYYYVRTGQDLGEVFAGEFEATRTTVASALEVSIDPGPGVTVLDAAGYPLERSGERVTFRPGALFAGQERRIWVTLSVPNQSAGDHSLGRFSLAYSRGGERTSLAFDETPRVASVATEDDFYARVDKSAWTRSIVVDGYNKMQEEVARDVKEGRREAALKKVADFRAEQKQLNDRVQSPEVAQKLDSLGKLEADVESVFHGENQAARQNELSKAQTAASFDERRAGAKK